jgi:hypothetical protein
MNNTIINYSFINDFNDHIMISNNIFIFSHVYHKIKIIYDIIYIFLSFILFIAYFFINY